MTVLSALGEDCSSVLGDLKLDPSELVIRYGDPVTVNCSYVTDYAELNWILATDYVFHRDNQTVTWQMFSLTDWEIEPQCNIKVDDLECNKTLPLTIYSKYLLLKSCCSRCHRTL